LPLQRLNLMTVKGLGGVTLGTNDIFFEDYENYFHSLLSASKFQLGFETSTSIELGGQTAI